MLLDYQQHAPQETGGVLMGYWVSPEEVVVAHATSAGPNARHMRDGYEPDIAHDQVEIARIYESSGRLHTYLGDWHTHPATGPGMSRRDRRTLVGIAADPGARASAPLMVIVGWEVDSMVAAVWCLPSNRTRAMGFRIRVFGGTGSLRSDAREGDVDPNAPQT